GAGARRGRAAAADAGRAGVRADRRRPHWGWAVSRPTPRRSASRWNGATPARPSTATAGTAEMSIDMLTPNPANERDETQDGADELVDAIREQGVLQPLGIAPVSAAAEEWPEHADELTASGATWCVILGNRRLWAAAKAGLETVPVYKISGDLRVAMLSENVNRQDMRPLAEADVLLELVNRLGGQQQAASALGRSQGWVSQRLALRRLAPELQAAIEAGELTARDARSYTSLSHDE